MRQISTFYVILFAFYIKVINVINDRIKWFYINLIKDINWIFPIYHNIY